MHDNQRVVFTRQGVVELQPSNIPQIAEAQLLIRTRMSLISPGTERAFLLGLPNTTKSYPMGSGYSNIGEVVEVGANVEGWKVGDRVANRGNHARFVAVDIKHCRQIPAGLADEDATFFQLSSIAMQAVRKARIELGEPVAVIGAGIVGLLAMQLARINGAVPSISIDLDEARLAFAQKVGADAILNAKEDLAGPLADLCEQEGPAVVLEATGHPDAAPMAFDLARRHGRVVLLGSTRGETEMVNFYSAVHKRGLTILGAHESTRPQVDSYPGWWTMPDDQRTAIKLLASKRLIVSPLITHRYPWRQAVDAYEQLKTWDKETLGILLDWQDG